MKEDWFIMGNYMKYVQAIASVWVIMLLLGLLCCCLSSKPRFQDDKSGSTGGCTCDGGYGGVWPQAESEFETYGLRIEVFLGYWGLN